ncbi:MAG: CAP domain-containing protein [Flavobacteriales bacterium]|nr:CAP domain-containing protein [Flavobacteriales bacterium]
MKANIKFVLGVVALFLFSAYQSNAQDCADNIASAIDGNLIKRALKLADDAMEDEACKKDPEVYFLRAEVLYLVSKDEFLKTKYPDAIKDAIKSIDKGMAKNNNQIPSSKDELINKLVEENNLLGEYQYKINKYTQAVKIYEKSYELNGDEKALYWIGKSYLQATDTVLGEQTYKQLLYSLDEQIFSEKKVDKLFADAYIYYADKHWRLKQYDSANFYLENAKKAFKDNARVDYFLKEVAKQQINELPPSSLMMLKINNMMKYFPTDSFFIKKQNALYLYLLRNHFDHNNLSEIDTMLKYISAEKVAKMASKDVELIKKSDQFIESKPENVLWDFVKYYSKFDYPNISNYIAQLYIEMTATGKTPADLKQRYNIIIDFAAKNHSLALANQLLEFASAKYGDADFVATRTSLISKYKANDLSTADQGALYAMLVKANPNLSKMSDELKEVAEKYINSLVKDKEYVKAKPIINQLIKAQPDVTLWQDKLSYLAKEDFYYNYYMTRVMDETTAGILVKGYEWNGSVAGCNPGTIDPKIQQKVEDRINYFRRQTGLKSVYLDAQLNDWCQKAALMMEVNKTLDHSPTTKWSCFSDDGAEAAKYSMLTKGVTTAIAVTSFMADNQNPSVATRRWLLYPNALAIGHGSTENVCVIWAMDDSGSVDTNVYKEKFVAWPPEGNLPKMLVFDYWSFSTKQDLKGATVTMKKGNENIPLKTQELVDGYGLPTLVWKPEFNAKDITEDTVVAVSVQLRNGRKYDYKVKVMNFDAVGY